MKKITRAKVYTESVIYMVTLCLLLLLTRHPEMREHLYGLFTREGYQILGLAFIAGIPLSFYVVFKKGKKENSTMLILWIYLFAINVFIFFEGLRNMAKALMSYNVGLYGILILTWVNLMFLLGRAIVLWMEGKQKKARISQKDATRSELIAATIICGGLFLLLDVFAKLPWIATFEIVMSYGLFANPFVSRWIRTRWPNT